MAFDPQEFPHLNSGNHREESPEDVLYNCIAWAAGYDDIIWDGVSVSAYWPPSAPRDYNITSLVIAFESEGFEVCADGSLEQDIEKIALYADRHEYTHAARQLETGKWTSKMGPGVRIEHDAPEDLVGPASVTCRST